MKFSRGTKFLVLAMILGSLLPTHAQGAILVAVQHQETTTPINGELGSILQLPDPVKTVTPSRYFKIRDISGGPDGGRTNVRTFHVVPVAGAKPEPVTFVLASGKALALKLIPTPGADKFLDIELDATSKKSREGKFLAPEMQMMRAMILGETAGFSTESTDQKIDAPFDSLNVTLTRVYMGEGLTGYVFKLQNTTGQPLTLHLSSLGLGEPNRAILSQADRHELAPCPLLSKGADCETTLRLVVGGPRQPVPVLVQKGAGIPPFLKKTDASSAKGDLP
jgi:hypothetical protein